MEFILGYLSGCNLIICTFKLGAFSCGGAGQRDSSVRGNPCAVAGLKRQGRNGVASRS